MKRPEKISDTSIKDHSRSRLGISHDHHVGRRIIFRKLRKCRTGKASAGIIFIFSESQLDDSEVFREEKRGLIP
jgi:hypothetical protein